MAFKNIAVFGANGQLGQSIIRALLDCKNQRFNVIGVIQSKTPRPGIPNSENYQCREIDLLNVTQDKLKTALEGIDAVISALSGKALDVQPLIQDGAADAGVSRFYPSEYGFHQIYRKPGSDWGYIHPLWDMKTKHLDFACHHDAIEDGHMSYTVIGCGDFYNQDLEPVWCPWTQRDPPGGEYTLHVVGSPDAKAQFTHIDDFARFLVATLCEPAKSENAHLNYISDDLSYRDIAKLMEKYTSRKVNLKNYREADLHTIVKDPSKAPKELSESSTVPVDFSFLVKGAQGQRAFRRPKGEIHNHLFPDVKPTTFEDYLQGHHAKGAK